MRISIALVVVVGLVGFSADAYAQICGHSQHWVDGCVAPGLDSRQAEAIVEMDLDFDCITDTQLILSGPTKVQRQGSSDASVNFPGEFGSAVDEHIDVIDTEIISMSLTGGGATFTAGLGFTPGGDQLNPSLGVVVEQAGDPVLADAFFDVFFEIDPGGGAYMYNHLPLRLQSVIKSVPPENQPYVIGPLCLPVFDRSTSVGAVLVGNITGMQHTIVPPSSIPALGPAGLITIGIALAGVGGAWLRRKGILSSTRPFSAAGSHTVPASAAVLRPRTF